MLLLDHNEFGLYAIHQELEVCTAQGLGVELVPLLGSVINPERLHAICERYRPATVYHAAAYKHVPMVEDNPGEGVRNNVFGTQYIAQGGRRRRRRFRADQYRQGGAPHHVMGL